jgi:hypothetical protein
MEAGSQHVHCVCGATVPVPPGAESVACPACAAEIVVDGTRISVKGKTAREVKDVAVALAKQEAEHKAKRDEVEAQRKRAAKALAGPWTSGLFYLLAIAVIVGLVLAVVAVVPLWAVPGRSLGGDHHSRRGWRFQLRHDNKLSEKGFMSLMKLALSEARAMARTKPPAV